jgi:hypothetical protein
MKNYIYDLSIFAYMINKHKTKYILNFVFRIDNGISKQSGTSTILRTCLIAGKRSQIAQKQRRALRVMTIK